MRKFIVAAVAAGGLALAASAAQAAHGSGTITFGFTGFSGPFGSTKIANLADMSQWLLVGSVNGQTPTVNGVNGDAGSGFLYPGGTAPLSGHSVDMVYANVPGALDNIVSFTPNPLGFNDVNTGDPFLLGTIAFTNGQWVGGSGNPLTNFPTTLNFTLSTHSSTPEFNQTLNDSIVMVTNQAANGDIDCDTNEQTRQDEADFVYIGSAPSIGSGRVYDKSCAPPGVSNFGTVELWAKFGSLDYVNLRNPTGGMFLSDSVGVGPIGGGVPEPAAWALMIAGFGLTGAALRGRRGRSAIA